MTIITHWNATLTEAVVMAQAPDAEGVRQGAEAALSRELGGVQVRLLTWVSGEPAFFPELSPDVAEALAESIARLRESYATLIRVATRTLGNAAERQILQRLDAELLVPLQGQAEPIGAMAVSGLPSLAELPEERTALLEFVGAQAATALDHLERMQRQEVRLRGLERRVRDLERVLVLAAHPGASLHPATVARTLLLDALGLATASRGAVAAYEGPTFHLLASRGLPSDRPGEVAAGLLAPPELDAERPYALNEAGELHLGLFFQGRALGFLMLGKRVLGPYRPDEIELLRALATHGAIALAHARQHEALQRGAAGAEPATEPAG